LALNVRANGILPNQTRPQSTSNQSLVVSYEHWCSLWYPPQSVHDGRYPARDRRFLHTGMTTRRGKEFTHIFKTAERSVVRNASSRGKYARDAENSLYPYHTGRLPRATARSRSCRAAHQATVNVLTCKGLCLQTSLELAGYARLRWHKLPIRWTQPQLRASDRPSALWANVAFPEPRLEVEVVGLTLKRCLPRATALSRGCRTNVIRPTANGNLLRYSVQSKSDTTSRYQRGWAYRLAPSHATETVARQPGCTRTPAPHNLPCLPDKMMPPFPISNSPQN
jgi:hypothetical protein